MHPHLFLGSFWAALVGLQYVSPLCLFYAVALGKREFDKRPLKRHNGKSL